MSVYKVPLEQNVLEAAQERIMDTETLPRVCVSFLVVRFRTYVAPDGSVGAQNE